MRPKRILVAPLDWGLGHASRCIPIIRQLMKRGCHVFVAGSGPSLDVIKNEFSELKCFSLDGYNPEYSHTSSQVAKLARQVLRFRSTIKREHQQMENLVEQNEIDIVLSDNRFGCWSVKAYSVFLTHQLNIQVPKSIRWMAPIINWFNKRYIRKFDQCWIPDYAGEKSIAGELSSEGRLPIHYVGPLSRFKSPCADKKFTYGVTAILSGPEPQRTLLENLIIGQLKGYNIRALLIRGVLDKDGETHVEDNLEIVNFLPTTDIQQAICSSELILSRSGYSTIMDLMVLGGKAFFIPTPGQTEQEYLAKSLEQKGIAGFCEQNRFNLHDVIEKSAHYSGFIPNKDETSLETAVSQLLERRKN